MSASLLPLGRLSEWIGTCPAPLGPCFQVRSHHRVPGTRVRTAAYLFGEYVRPRTPAFSFSAKSPCLRAASTKRGHSLPCVPPVPQRASFSLPYLPPTISFLVETLPRPHWSSPPCQTSTTPGIECQLRGLTWPPRWRPGSCSGAGHQPAWGLSSHHSCYLACLFLFARLLALPT